MTTINDDKLYGWQSEERYREDGETRRDDFSHPSLRDGVAITDRRHRNLRVHNNTEVGVQFSTRNTQL